MYSGTANKHSHSTIFIIILCEDEIFNQEWFLFIHSVKSAHVAILPVDDIAQTPLNVIN